MSRIRQEISSVQFQIDARKANASMDALQAKAKELNDSIETTKADIKALGDVKPDNDKLLQYQKTLRELTRDLNDVTRAQRDLVKGVKAADKLWEAASKGDIESMSIKGIKAGQRGLQQRMQGLNPKDGEDAKVLRAYKAVIEEADIVVKKFQADTDNLVSTIKSGGTVSVDVLTQAKNDLKGLMDLVGYGTEEWQGYKTQLEVVSTKLNSFGENERRLAGEVVTVNDALKLSKSLTKDAIAERQRLAKDEMESVTKTSEIMATSIEANQKRIEQTKQEIEATQKEIEQKKEQIDLVYDLMEAEDQAERITADAQKVVDKERETYKKLYKEAFDASSKVVDLQEQIAKLNAAPVKPQVDTSELDRLKAKLEEVKKKAERLADETRFNPTFYKGRETVDAEIAYERSQIAEYRKRIEGVGDVTAKRNELLAMGQRKSGLKKAEYNYFKAEKDAIDYIESLKSKSADIKKEFKSVADEMIELKTHGFDFNGLFDSRNVAEFYQRLKTLKELLQGLGKDVAMNLRPDGTFPDYSKMQAWVEQQFAQLEQLKKTYQEAHVKAGSIKKNSEAYWTITGNESTVLDNENYIRLSEKRIAQLEELKKVEQEEKQLTEQLAEAAKVSAQAAKAEAKATEELEQAEKELEQLRKHKKDHEAGLASSKSYLDESLKALQQMGLTEADLEDEAKVREAAEKKVLEILEAQANVEKEVAEQRRKMASEIKMSDLGGTKADQEFYAKQKGNYDLEQYDNLDDVMARIGHLETVSRLKNGRKFSDETTWNPEDELDEDEAIIMTDQERQAAKDELRVLQQHIREVILKSIQEVGDINKGIEEATGGDGVSEDAKFGERLNDKLDALKDKIEERIVTTLDSYNDIIGEDHEEGIDKGELKRRVEGHLSSLAENVRNDRVFYEEDKESVQIIDQQIAAKQQEIEVIKQGTQATEQSNEVNEQRLELEGKLAEAQQELTEKKTAALGASKKLSDAEEKLKKAEDDEAKATDDLAKAKKGMNLDEEEKNVEALTKKHEGLTESLKDQEEMQENLKNSVASTEERQKQAAIELAQANSVSQEKIEESISILEKAKKKASDPDDVEEMEEALDNLNEKLKEMTGEWMSLADAQKLAEGADIKSFSKEGGNFLATPQQLQQSVQALNRYKDTLIQTIQKKRDAGNATKAEEAELEKVEKQLKDLKFEQDNYNMSHKKMMDLLKEPKKSEDLDELRTAIKRADGELKRMKNSLGENSKEYQEYAKQVKNAKIQLGQMEQQSKATASAFDKAWSRLKTYVGLYVGAAVAMQKIVATMGDLMELSDKMGEVRKTTGFTADEVGRLSDNLKKLDVRTSLTSLMELSSLAGSVGLKTQEDVQGFTEAANQLMIALPEMGNESARTLIKIATATGDLKKNNDDVRETLERVGSTIIALRANSASAAGPITDFVSRVGAVGAQAGISIDQIAALGSTIDTLGGRVEMSATALSRMIPAIRNNAFGVANAIGVTEKTLTDLFNQGKSMEAMVLIFQKMRESVKQFDTSTEEGMNAMADNVEALLGKNASMAEVMKELNQQGARAGIVFGLLSQNVDELQRQLGLAGEAYSKNMALQEEYNKMNDTTAAKWERLKNQFEEMFVGDTAQRRLGWIIDRLRDLVDLISADGPLGSSIRFLIFSATMLKAKWAEAIGSGILSIGSFISSLYKSTAVTTADTAAKTANAAATTAVGVAAEGAAVKTNILTAAWGKLNATMKANIIGLVVTSLIWLGLKLMDAAEEAKKAAAEVGKFNQKLDDEKKALDSLFTPLEKSNLAQSERSKLITEINSKYSKYLGYMLSETNSAIALADAHALVAKRIREEAYEKRILEQEDTVQKKYEKDINAGYGRLVETVRKYATSGTDANEVADYLNAVIQSNTSLMAKSPGMYNPAWTPEFGTQWNAAVDRMIQSGKLRNVQGLKSDLTIMTSSYLTAVKKQEEEIESATAATRSDLRNVQKSIKTEVQNNLASLVDDVRNYGKTVVKATTEATTEAIPQTIAKPDETKKIGKNWNWGGTAYEGQTPKTTKKELKEVQEVGEWKPNVNKQDIEQVKKFVETQDQLRGYLQQNAESISEQSRATAEAYLVSEEELEKLRDLLPKGTTNKPTKEPNPYGDFNRVMDSYDKWDADSLVARRKEMLERVRTLANGADVQAVLSEDAKFISEATRKNIKTTRDAIEWYNTERLKIQESLHEKHLTNTGDWMDPTQRKGREKTLKAEWKEYLDELDAYYTARKTKIQDARNDELITEAEAWRRTLQNDAEWRQRRAELQQLYANKSVKVSAEETQAIYDILAEQTGESSDYIKKDIAQTVKFILAIGAKSKDEMEKLIGQIDKGTEQDFFRQRVAIGKQMDAIADIIEKERPFNGITENLQANLTKMGVLQADFEKKRNALLAKREDTSEVDREMEEAIPQRISFLLEEAEHAYNTTIDEVLKRMADKGMKVWADEIKSDTMMQEALMGQLHSTFDKVQEAIKKEASLWKKEAENMWNNILMPDGKTTLKQLADQVTAQLSLDANRVGRANNLIGAGQASERVVDKLAIQQMKVQLAMQQHYYNLMRERGQAAIKDLERQAALARERNNIEEATRKELDAQHARMTLNLATTKEQTELAKQQEEIIARTEESQNRLYKELKSWAELLASSIQELFEAEHAGDKEYYNERAKMALTGKGGPGAGTYVVIENEGTSSAKAHYEYLSEEEALEREHQIEVENARAEAWKKVMDEFNEKLNDAITDQINAMLQNQSIDANTQAVIKNTEALYATAEGKSDVGGLMAEGGKLGDMGLNGDGVPNALVPPTENSGTGTGSFDYTKPFYEQMDASNLATKTLTENNKKATKSTRSSFAAMTAAANMYGLAYQAMVNDNLDTTQKVEMMIVQAAGQAAISMLTATLAASQGETAANAPAWISKTLKELGPIGGPVAVGVFTALLGGLMGMAVSKISKSKAQIAQATGASAASAGKLTTGMITYAEGNVNEFTDPGTLTEGRHYNVDAADGRTYRAKYMGKNAKTHITNGPEFHLVGEKGREAIIDAKTTRQIQMDDNGIWRSIQTLYNGGRISSVSRRRGRGVMAFADGNIDEFDSVDSGQLAVDSYIDLAGMQASLDRNSAVQEALLERLSKPIQAKFDVYGKGGLLDSYDTGKKTVNRHGERY